jgi:hypothetical protein
MNRKRLTILFALAALIGTTGNSALAQTSKTEQELAANSKKAIIATGISEPYFDEHFRLIKVIDEAGDRRVEWKYSINEYETTLFDDVGYFTSDTGQRTDVHSIKNELFSAYDIKTTITRNKADAALKSCIGEHSVAQVVYRPLKAPGKARLYLSAHAITPLESEEEKEKDKNKDKDKETEREIEGIFFNIGYVDLETGKCSIERGKVTP